MSAECRIRFCLRIVRRVGGWLGFMVESEVGKSLKTEKLGNRAMFSSVHVRSTLIGKKAFPQEKQRGSVMVYGCEFMVERTVKLAIAQCPPLPRDSADRGGAVGGGVR